MVIDSAFKSILQLGQPCCCQMPIWL